MVVSCGGSPEPNLHLTWARKALCGQLVTRTWRIATTRDHLHYTATWDFKWKLYSKYELLDIVMTCYNFCDHTVEGTLYSNQLYLQLLVFGISFFFSDFSFFFSFFFLGSVDRDVVLYNINLGDLVCNYSC